MPKQSNKQSSDGNGGIMGSGIFGLFGSSNILTIFDCGHTESSS